MDKKHIAIGVAALLFIFCMSVGVVSADQTDDLRRYRSVSESYSTGQVSDSSGSISQLQFKNCHTYDEINYMSAVVPSCYIDQYNGDTGLTSFCENFDLKNGADLMTSGVACYTKMDANNYLVTFKFGKGFQVLDSDEIYNVVWSCGSDFCGLNALRSNKRAGATYDGIYFYWESGVKWCFTEARMVADNDWRYYVTFTDEEGYTAINMDTDDCGTVSVSTDQYEYMDSVFGCDNVSLIVFELPVSVEVVDLWGKTHTCMYAPGMESSISGTVYDAQTGAAVVGAVVNLSDAFNESLVLYDTVSNSVGYYCLNCVERGDYVINVSVSGYQNLTFDVDFTGGALNLDLYMVPIVPNPTDGTATFYGIVYDYDTYDVIPFVLVSVDVAGDDYYCYSNSRGFFMLDGVAPGTAAVLLSKAGYTTLQDTVTLTENVSAFREYYMQSGEAAEGGDGEDEEDEGFWDIIIPDFLKPEHLNYWLGLIFVLGAMLVCAKYTKMPYVGLGAGGVCSIFSVMLGWFPSWLGIVITVLLFVLAAKMLIGSRGGG